MAVIGRVTSLDETHPPFFFSTLLILPINFITMPRRFNWSSYCLGGLGIIVLLLLLGSFTVVEYGTVGLISRLGKVTDKKLYPGLHFKVPVVDKTIKYNTQKVTYEASVNPEESEATYSDYPVDTTTQDGQQVEIRYTVRFSVDPTKAKWVAENIGLEKDVVEKVVKTDSRIFARNIPREYRAEELYTGNVTSVSTKIENTLRPKFEANGLLLDEFGIRQIQFEQDYIDAVEAKQIAKERVTTEKHKAEQEKHKKEQAITKAEAEAKAQELQQKTLNAFLLEKLRLEKWNGVYPKYYFCGSKDLMFNLPNESK